MLKIVYPICCGMDVHKSFVVACIASTNGHGVTTYKSKRFSTLPAPPYILQEYCPHLKTSFGTAQYNARKNISVKIVCI